MNDTKINDGGPAFPCVVQVEDNSGSHYEERYGLTIRDWFAGQALQGQAYRLASPWEYCDILAKECYDIADSMLAARKEKV